MSKRTKLMVLVIVVLTVTLFGTAVAMAKSEYVSKLPADKASASCMACHSSIPALNADGQAFANNGHTWPAASATTKESTTTTKESTTTAKESTTTAPAPKPAADLTEGQFAKMLTDAGYYVTPENSGAAITRNQAAVMVVQALGIANTAKDTPASEASAILKKFSDASKIKNANLVAAAVKNSLMAGYGSSFGAADKLTENQAKILVANVTKNAASVGALPNYVGSETCKACHSEYYSEWKSTGHSRHVLSVDAPGALAVPFDSNPYFNKSQALYRVGGMTQYRFLGRGDDGDYYYLGGSWDIESASWIKNTSLSDWSTGCASCHTTGYNKASKQFDEWNITCESCHGPGLQHVLGGGDTTKIKVSVDNDTCASCHSGQVTELEGMGHTWAKEDGTDRAGHTNHFKESLTEGSALSGHYSDNCMECHSATVFLDVEKGVTPPTLEDFKTGPYQDDRVGISCVVCHDPHNKAQEAQLRKDPYETCIQCHTNEGDIKSGTTPHHPQKEFFDGEYLVAGTLYKQPTSAHFECATCHMANGNHAFEVGDPTLTRDVHGTPTEFNSCISCHKDAEGRPTMTAARMSAFMNDTKDRLAAINADWAKITAKKDSLTGADLQTYNDDVTNLGLLGAEGSSGIHNPTVTETILSKVEKDVTALKKTLGI